MKLMKLAFPAFLFLAITGVGYTMPYGSSVYSTPVTQEDGDTISTYNVTVSSSVVTLISAAESPTNSMRRRVIHNTGTYDVYIGTNTSTLATTGYKITASTGTASVFETRSKAAIYGLSTTASGTVKVLKETNSIP